MLFWIQTEDSKRRNSNLQILRSFDQEFQKPEYKTHKMISIQSNTNLPYIDNRFNNCYAINSHFFHKQYESIFVGLQVCQTGAARSDLLIFWITF